MSNESQYYNPIIQAMIASAQQAQHAQNLQLERERLAQETAYRQAQAKHLDTIANLEAKRMEYEHEHQQGTLDIAAKNLANQIEQNKIDNILKTRQAIASGVPPSTFQHPGANTPPVNVGGINLGAIQGVGATPPGMIDIPGAGRVPLQGFRTPQEEANFIRQNAAAQAGAVATAQHQAAEPFAIAAEQRKAATEKDLLETKNKAESALLDKRLTTEKDIAQLSRSTQLSVAAMNNHAHLQGLEMEYGLSPQQAVGLTNAIATGQVKPSISNPVERKLVASMEESGFKIPGTDIDELRTLQNVNQALDKFEAFAGKLPQNKTGQTWNVLNQHNPLSGTKKDYEQVLGNLQTVAKGLEQYSGGRVLSAQFSGEAGSVPSMTDTQQQALSKVNALRQRLNQRKSQILSAYPSAQREMISKLGVDTSAGTKHFVDPKTGEHYNIPAEKSADFLKDFPNAMEVQQ